MKINLFYILLVVVVMVTGSVFYISHNHVVADNLNTVDLNSNINSATNLDISASPTTNPTPTSASVAPVITSRGTLVPPTVLTSANITDSSIIVSWNSTKSTAEVVGYRIYRNGIMIGTTSAQKFNDTGLKPSDIYSYAISAYDKYGRASEKSNSLSVSTLIPMLKLTPIPTLTPSSVQTPQPSRDDDD